MKVKSFHGAILLLIVSTVVSVTCSVKQFVWKPIAYNDRAVWSEDATAIAIVRLSYEERQSFDPLMGTTEKRNFEHQLFIRSVTAQDNRPLAPRRPHQVVTLYYMKQVGYVLVQTAIPGAVGASQFYKVDIATQQVSLILDVPPLSHWSCYSSTPPEVAPPPARVDYNVIPSPTGEFLVVTQSPQCGSAKVTFLDARTLTTISEQIVSVPEFMNATWHPDNYFILAGSKYALRFEPRGQSPLPIQIPGCIVPVTSSSDITADGRVLILTSNGLNIQPANDRRGFGCQ